MTVTPLAHFTLSRFQSPIKKAVSLEQVTTIYNNPRTTTTPPSTMDLISACPVEVMLTVFGHLSSADLLNLASTSKQMRGLAGSDHVWKRRLQSEMPAWQSVTAATLPGHQGMCFRVQQTYMKCSPVLRDQTSRRRMRARAAGATTAATKTTTTTTTGDMLPFRLAANTMSIGAKSAMVRMLTGAPAPQKMAVFGLGMDTAGRGLLGALLWSPGSPFVVEGMEAGSGGVGGSITVRHTAMDTPVSMVALYDPHAADQTAEVDGHAPPPLPQLTAPHQAVLQQMETVVYCVDAELLADGGSVVGSDAHAHAHAHAAAAIAELRAYLAHTAGPNVPVVVLAVSRPGAAKAAGPVEVAQKLSLTTLSRKWRVQVCPVSPALSSPLESTHACREPLDKPLATALEEATEWLLRTSAAAKKSAVAIGFESSMTSCRALINPARSVVASLLAGF